MLEVTKVDAYYGASHVLRGVSFSVGRGETVSLLGRNGAGKTTTLHTIMGVHRQAKGSITFNGRELLGLPGYQVMQHGIGLVPEGRQIFPTLTLFENLKMGYIGKKKDPDHWPLNEYVEVVCSLFPPLAERLKHKGKQLSGGEQQMLAIARALGSRPQFLMFDEPTEGLAPLIVERISETIVELKRQNVSMLLVTQDTSLAMEVSKRIFFMEKGSIRYEGSSQDVADHPEIRLRYLGV
jgi:branched-chain amino acid transport system ATP-binding protein